LRGNGAQPGTTYYFRAFDQVNGEAVLAAQAHSYPSLVLSAGTITYSSASVNPGFSVDGVTSNISANPSSVEFGTVSPGLEKIGIQSFEIDTTAGGGYRLLAYSRQNLLSANGADIDPVPGSNDDPEPWPLLPAPSAFGYHSSDDTLSGSSPARFAPDNSYAAFTSTPAEIAYSPVPVHNELINLVYRLAVSQDQEAGNYQTEVNFILTPSFY
jgi:hypothetical protein